MADTETIAGNNARRLSDPINDKEASFARAWAYEQSKSEPLLNYLLSPEPNHPHLARVTERDEMVAATVIQWLGSNVGMHFLSSVLKQHGLEIVETKK